MKMSHFSLVTLALLLLGAGPAPTPATSAPMGLAAQPGDRLHVYVFELVTPGLPWEADLTVDPAGFLTLPNLGRVRVAGLRAVEIKALIEQTISDACGRLIGAPKGPGPEVRVQFADLV